MAKTILLLLNMMILSRYSITFLPLLIGFSSLSSDLQEGKEIYPNKLKFEDMGFYFHFFFGGGAHRVVKEI